MLTNCRSLSVTLVGARLARALNLNAIFHLTPASKLVLKLETETETEVEAEAEPEAGEESEPEAEAEAKPEAEAEAEAGARAGPGDEAERSHLLSSSDCLSWMTYKSCNSLLLHSGRRRLLVVLLL